MEKKIIEEITFNFCGEDYIARLYNPEKTNYVYGEIVFADSEERPEDMKYIASEYLRSNGIEIKTPSGRVKTHKAVKSLMKFLKRK